MLDDRLELSKQRREGCGLLLVFSLADSHAVHTSAPPADAPSCCRYSLTVDRMPVRDSASKAASYFDDPNVSPFLLAVDRTCGLARTFTTYDSPLERRTNGIAISPGPLRDRNCSTFSLPSAVLLLRFSSPSASLSLLQIPLLSSFGYPERCSPSFSRLSLRRRSSRPVRLSRPARRMSETVSTVRPSLLLASLAPLTSFSNSPWRDSRQPERAAPASSCLRWPDWHDRLVVDVQPALEPAGLLCVSPSASFDVPDLTHCSLDGTDPSNLDQQASSSESTTYPTSRTYNNHVKLTGLKPGTKYYYKVSYTNAPAAAYRPTYSFTTARAPGDTTPYSIAIFGDLGLMGDDGLSTKTGPIGGDNYTVIPDGAMNTIQSLLAAKDSYDFIYHTGDIAYNDVRAIFPLRLRRDDTDLLRTRRAVLPQGIDPRLLRLGRERHSAHSRRGRRAVRVARRAVLRPDAADHCRAAVARHARQPRGQLRQRRRQGQGCAHHLRLDVLHARTGAPPLTWAAALTSTSPSHSANACRCADQLHWLQRSL